MKKRLALLIGGGSCVPWVLEALDPTQLEIVLGVTHKSKSPGIELLRNAGIEILHEPRLRFTNNGRGGDPEYFQMVQDAVAKAAPDLVLCLGWDLVLPPNVVEYWHEMGIVTTNLHPALVSKDGRPVRTEYGDIPVIKGEVTHVIDAVLALKLPATGCSIHVIPPSGAVDEGRVIGQRVVQVLEGDSAESLRERERAAEKDLVQEFIRNNCDIPKEGDGA